jgi:hypothetical protein
LVHCDASKLIPEYLERIEHSVRPIADAKIQATAWHKQQRKAAAHFFVANPNVTLPVKRMCCVSP